MSAALKNLVLQEPRAAGRAKLTDAANPGLSLTSRFDLAYGAAFALSLSALHAAGDKPKDRVDAINCLEHTTALPLGHRRVIHRAHTMRNQAECEGEKIDDAQLITDLVAAGNALSALLPNP